MMDNLAKHSPRRLHWLIWVIPALVLVFAIVLATTSFLNRQRNRQHMRKVDERIVVEVEQALTQKLASLTEDDEIVQRYGKFIELTGMSWNRPNYGWQLVVRLDCSAFANFEKAYAQVRLGIDRGPTLAIQRLDMCPSEDWRRDHPEIAGELSLIDGELWLVKQQGKSRCTINGWARHPDFLYD